MKRYSFVLVLFLYLVVVTCANCSTKQRYKFNEGPVRVSCKAEQHFAMVNQPWSWACILEGDLSKYADSDIGIEITGKLRENEPSRSVVGTGLKRIYEYQTTFSEEYWRELTGHVVITDPRAELVSPDDPTYPAEPLEGLESSLDGSFYLEVAFYELIDYNPFASSVREAKLIAKGRFHGRLDCPQCTV